MTIITNEILNGFVKGITFNIKGYINKTYFCKQTFRKGVDIQTVSKLLGHYNPTISQNIYIHILEEQKVKAVKIFNTI